MESWEKFESKKSMRSNKVFSVLEGIYCREWYMGKKGRFEKYKEGDKRV